MLKKKGYFRWTLRRYYASHMFLPAQYKVFIISTRLRAVIQKQIGWHFAQLFYVGGVDHCQVQAWQKPRIINVRDYISEAFSESSQASKVECFAKIVNDFQLLITFAKRSIFDVLLGSEYASAFTVKKLKLMFKACVRYFL